MAKRPVTRRMSNLDVKGTVRQRSLCDTRFTGDSFIQHNRLSLEQVICRRDPSSAEVCRRPPSSMSLGLRKTTSLGPSTVGDNGIYSSTKDPFQNSRRRLVP